LRSTVSSVAIIGGGISGLAAAYELSRRGVPFVLFERAPSCGGVIVTDRVDGYTIDAGPDALLTQKPEAIALCRDLGVASRLRPQRARTTFVVRNQRLQRLPNASVFGIPAAWRPFATTRAFSWRGKLRMASEVFLPPRPAAGDESIASFIGRRFGREAVDYLAEPLLAGIHGGDPSRLSMRAAFPRFLDLEAKYRSVILGLRSVRAAAPQGVSSSAFVAMSGGMADLTASLVGALPRDSIRTGVGVTGLTDGAAGYVLSLDTGARTIVPSVIVATPPKIASRLLQPLDDRLAALCGQTATTSAVTIALGYARSAVRHPLNGTGFVVPRREQLSIRAASWVSSKWADRAPSDRVLLRVYVGGAADPGAVDRTDAALLADAQHDLARLLHIVGEPELVRVYRWRDATPQLNVGHRERMTQIERYLSAHPRLAMTASGFRGTGIADCVADARRQAATVAQDFARASAMSERTLSTAG
jgi:protoporphyrinogen/coproporphyrinogen III oxidase